jgi:hypothetical protein
MTSLHSVGRTGNWNVDDFGEATQGAPSEWPKELSITESPPETAAHSYARGSDSRHRRVGKKPVDIDLRMHKNPR